MKLYFAWIEENEVFKATSHALNDLHIFSLSLQEREGEFPLVIIEVQNPYAGLLNIFPKQWCFISYDKGEGVTLLFKGKLCFVPHSLEGEVLKLNFTASPSDWKSGYNSFIKR